MIPFTSVNGDVVALRKRAAGLVRGEKLPADEDNAPTNANDKGDTSTTMPFDRTCTRGVANIDKNTIFMGTLSSQSKVALTKMASVLGIPVMEKDRKQGLTLKIRERLDANPGIRNDAQFAQLIWRSGNRKAATTSATPTPAPETPYMLSHQQVPSYFYHSALDDNFILHRTQVATSWSYYQC